MLRIKTILFPTDFSECAEHAYQHAAYLAEQHDATLHVLNIARSRAADPDNPMSYLDAGDLDAPPQALQGTQPAAGVRVVYAQEWEVSEARGILRYAEQEGIDLIVMGTHCRRGLDRLLLGSVAEAVARDAPCPVLITPALARQHPQSVARVLVPVDFSAHAGVALAYARHVAALHNAALTLLFVAEEPLVPFFSDTGIPTFTHLKMDPDIIARADDALRQLAANTAGPAVPLTTVIRRGQPFHEVVDCAAETEADLIVMATRGLSGIERGLLGSVTERVVRLASCPVWTLNPRVTATSTAFETAPSQHLGEAL